VYCASSGKENMNSVLRNSCETTCNTAYFVPGLEEGVVHLKFSGVCFHSSAIIIQCLFSWNSVFSYFFLLSLSLSRIFPLLCILFYVVLEMQDIFYKTCYEYYSMMPNLQKYCTWILIKYITFITLNDPCVGCRTHLGKSVFVVYLYRKDGATLFCLTFCY